MDSGRCRAGSCCRLFWLLILHLGAGSSDAFFLDAVFNFVSDLHSILPELLPPIFFPGFRCTLSFFLLNLDLTNFEAYATKYFRDDSIMVNDKTGEYQGAAGIEEYVKFTVDSFSPFFVEAKLDPPEDLAFLGYNRDKGQCEFRAMNQGSFQTDSATTSGSFSYTSAVMFRIYYDFYGKYLARVHVYEPDGWFELIAEKFLDSDNTNNYICSILLSDDCVNFLPNNNNSNMSAENCTARLDALPVTTGNRLFVDGNSRTCRALHASLASSTPEQHCAHVSFDPVPDLKGNIKCQTSQGAQATDYFDAADFTAWEAYARKKAMDPARGHTCC